MALTSRLILVKVGLVTFVERILLEHIQSSLSRGVPSAPSRVILLLLVGIVSTLLFPHHALTLLSKS